MIKTNNKCWVLCGCCCFPPLPLSPSSSSLSYHPSWFVADFISQYEGKKQEDYLPPKYKADSPAHIKLQKQYF